MRTSKEGLLLIEQREGKRNSAYLDSKGILTIGVGHTGPDVTAGLVWSDEQILTALETDVKSAEYAVNLYCASSLQQYMFDALVSFVFNIGIFAFRKSTLLHKLNQGDFAGAAKEFERWVIPKEIISRRMGEKSQFLGKPVARASTWT